MVNDLLFPPAPEDEQTQDLSEDSIEVGKVMERKRRLAYGKAVQDRFILLLSAIYQLFKTAQIHDLANAAFQAPLEQFCKDLNSLPQEDEFQISFVEDMVYVNDSRLKTDITNFLSIKNLAKELGVRGIGGLTFRKGLEKSELNHFVQAFTRLDQKLDSPIEALKEQMETLQVKNIGIEAPRAVEDIDSAVMKQEDRSKLAMKTYFKAISSYKAIMKNIQNERLGDARKAKKIVQKLVDLCFEEGSSFLGLATIKNFDEYTYNHSVNVCIISIAFGQKLGLNKRQLCDLGLAALFHDIGKTSIPLDVLNKSGKFSDAEWELMKSHPVMGVKAILRMRGFSESTIYRILVAHQHHIGLDGSGYPSLRQTKNMHFYTRIISIVDTFDAMTTSRVYQKAMRPDEALRLICKTVFRRYDPLLLKAFVNTIGVFPVGSLVQLSNKQIAVVVEAQEDASLMRQPKVKVAMGADGQILHTPVLVDLGECHSDGSFKLTIQKSLDPKEYKINIPHYVLIS